MEATTSATKAYFDQLRSAGLWHARDYPFRNSFVTSSALAALAQPMTCKCTAQVPCVLRGTDGKVFRGCATCLFVTRDDGLRWSRLEPSGLEIAVRLLAHNFFAADVIRLARAFGIRAPCSHYAMSKARKIVDRVSELQRTEIEERHATLLRSLHGTPAEKAILAPVDSSWNSAHGIFCTTHVRLLNVPGVRGGSLILAHAIAARGTGSNPDASFTHSHISAPGKTSAALAPLTMSRLIERIKSMDVPAHAWVWIADGDEDAAEQLRQAFPGVSVQRCTNHFFKNEKARNENEDAATKDHTQAAAAALPHRGSARTFTSIIGSDVTHDEMLARVRELAQRAAAEHTRRTHRDSGGSALDGSSATGGGGADASGGGADDGGSDSSDAAGEGPDDADVDVAERDFTASAARGRAFHECARRFQAAADCVEAQQQSNVLSAAVNVASAVDAAAADAVPAAAASASSSSSSSSASSSSSSAPSSSSNSSLHIMAGAAFRAMAGVFGE